MRENAGFVILYSYSLNEDEEVVLGKRTIEGYVDFVTWMCNNNKTNYFWGHYFENELDALKDLVKRVEKEKK